MGKGARLVKTEGSQLGPPFTTLGNRFTARVQRMAGRSLLPRNTFPRNAGTTFSTFAQPGEPWNENDTSIPLREKTSG